MTHATCSVPPRIAPASTALPRAVSASRHATMQSAAAGLARLVVAWRHRARSRAQLQAMDDRMLRDIGLDHLSAWDEARKPFWVP
ncbi:DUF1127 domain-containing protein [uncultured Rhodospira sp.]|uniref:DUF1127 domain-containing protein n=1 Tax=uncultured Rhodospira sp. TaxID=1936189 RepID=UPI00262D44D6|nr:DUF1127 domain-containing protein [uncultured Rhodospira sp.]